MYIIFIFLRKRERCSSNFNSFDNYSLFILSLVAKKKDYSTFEESIGILQNYAATKGLMDEDIDLLADTIINTELGECTNSIKNK